MSATVLAPGMQATVQDGGRHGLRHLGVGQCGALDPFSHAVANLLVGNAAGAPVLEAALVGPTLRFERPARIALCGASCDARVDGTAIPGWRPVDLPGGSELHVGPCTSGARAYLAIAGGWQVPDVLGSASTDLRGGFGGLHGRALERGDVLAVGPTPSDFGDALRIATWWINPAPELALQAPVVVHVLPGHDVPAPADGLFTRAWRVAAASNRQGLRMEGEALAADPAAPPAGQRVSEPVAPGTIQLPADGQPIVLLADAQTHGGYPRIGHAIAASRPRLAQLRAGDRVRFAPCTPQQAQRLRQQQAAHMARLRMAIADRLRETAR